MPEEGRRHCDKLRDLASLAEKLGCSPTQLSIAWSLKHESVQCLLLGATTPEQLHSSLQALQVSESIFSPKLLMLSKEVPTTLNRDENESPDQMTIASRYIPVHEYSFPIFSFFRDSPLVLCSNWNVYLITVRFDRLPYQRSSFGDNQPAFRGHPVEVASVGQIHPRKMISA